MADVGRVEEKDRLMVSREEDAVGKERGAVYSRENDEVRVDIDETDLDTLMVKISQMCKAKEIRVRSV